MACSQPACFRAAHTTSAPPAGRLPEFGVGVNLLGNGVFNDSTGWTLGTGCTVTGGKLHCANNAGNSTNSYAIALPPGKYRIRWQLSDFNAGNVTIRLNCSGSLVSGTTRSIGAAPAGVYTDVLTIAAESTALEVRATRSGTTMDFKVDNITIAAE